MQKKQDKDLPEMKEEDGLEKEEEAGQTEAETPQPEEDPEIQEVTENKDKPASDVGARDGAAAGEKDSLGNRFVKSIFSYFIVLTWISASHAL